MASIDKDKRALDIADYLFANPDARRDAVLTLFSEKWQVSTRTIDRLLAVARPYNEERIRIAREKRDEALYQNELEAENEAIMSRKRAIEILADIAEGKDREITIEETDGTFTTKYIRIPPADQIKALSQLSAMQGWDAPVQINSKVKVSTDHLTDEEKTALLGIARKAIK